MVTRRLVRYFCRALIILSTAVAGYYYLSRETLEEQLATLTRLTSFSTHNETEINEANSSQRPVVLIWDSFYGIPVNPFFTQEMADKCVHRCIFTRDRFMAPRSAAIVFHNRDFNSKQIPRRQSEKQIWVLFGMESPVYTPKESVALNGLINWTVTYRRDADVPFPYKHRLVRLSRNNTVERAPNVTKDRMAAWFVSHCNAHSGRQRFVKHLQKVIDVDIYGACGKHKCTPSRSPACYQMLAKKYYFYLSLENSLCRDYVTEKFYNVLAYDVVPVVMGYANYSAFSPPGSFIDALSFDSPQDLGKYLWNTVHVWKNYSSHFDWKRRYKAVREMHQAACGLCEKIYRNNSSPKVYTDIRKWWFDDGDCWTWKPNVRKSFREKNGTENQSRQ
ncbi:glycoprotein 3-alpha-L-fucosyltransferase A-like [Ornithodoros turicata]|uniref:glycoprotein 3-alpha-L-fucosyltransferase A-like n=1 Tax=Ornithodoros turicata TaxID=34597 RepID=UPI003138C00E